MSSHEVILAVTLLTLVLMATMLVFIRRYVRVPPNMAMVIYGKGPGRRQVMRDGKITSVETIDIVIGGGKFVPPIVAAHTFLPIDVHTIDVSAEEVVSKDKRGFHVAVIAQASVSQDGARLRTAAECLLGADDKTLEAVARDAIDEAIREAAGKRTIQEVNADRGAFADAIKARADERLGDVGMSVRSLVIKGIEGQDIEILGWPRTHEVMDDQLERRVAKVEEAIRRRSAHVES